MGPQDVDVIIPNYHSPHLAVDAARSARKNGAKSIIVVENGSKDDSLDVLNKEIGDFAKIISLSENRGYSGACNAGAAAGQRPFILFMNSDAILKPGSLYRMLNPMAEYSRVGVVCPSLYYPDGRPQPSAWLFITPWRIVSALFCMDHFSSRWPFLSANIDYKRNGDYSGPTESLYGACLLFRRKAVEEVNGFDEAFYSSCEDTDIIYRLSQLGWQTFRNASAKVIHIQGVSTKYFAVKAMISFQDSRWIYARKHFNVWGKMLTIFVSIVGMTFRLLFSRNTDDRKRYLAALGFWLGCRPVSSKKW